MEQDEFEAARQIALRFLAYAPRSRAEIEKRLAKAGIGPDRIAAVLAELEAQNWINDAQFAQDWIADRADRKRYGRTRLAAELRNRGVDREALQAALEGIDDEAELRRARAAAHPRWPAESLANAETAVLQKEKHRLATFLQRRGFSWRIIEQVLSELASNNN
jgi:regulatory protein